jgi:protein-disulfide isomerase
MHFRALALALLAACNGAGDGQPGSSAAASDTGSASQPAAATGAASGATTAAATATDPDVARADSARIRGSADAKVWLIVVSDFQCPYCRMWHDSTDLTIRREYVDNGRVRMAFLNFPLSNHQHALPAAEYAMCAGAQRRFWEMHDAIFESQTRWAGLPNATPVFDEVARKVGLDMNALQACVESDKMVPLIEGDYDRARRAGTQATPTFLIGDVKLEGAQPASEMRRALDAALAASGR